MTAPIVNKARADAAIKMIRAINRHLNDRLGQERTTCNSIAADLGLDVDTVQDVMAFLLNQKVVAVGEYVEDPGRSGFHYRPRLPSEK